MYNPRFPHRLSVSRVRKDTKGQPIYDANGDPIYDKVPLNAVLMNDGNPMTDIDGNLLTETIDEISFGYRTNSLNTRSASDVAVSDFKIATPMFITPLFPGDLLHLTDYDRTYTGEVVKKMTFNLGSNIWFSEIKN